MLYWAVEKLRGLEHKPLIFVHVTLYSLPLFIKKLYFFLALSVNRQRLSEQDKVSVFRQSYNVTQKRDTFKNAKTCSKITQTHLLTPYYK